MPCRYRTGETVTLAVNKRTGNITIHRGTNGIVISVNGTLEAYYLRFANIRHPVFTYDNQLV
jgi:hypothetical protein